MLRTILVLATFTTSVFLTSARATAGEGTLSVVQAVPPIYPSIARTALISGEVVIEATVDSQGSVAAVNVISGHELLNKSAEKAANRWKFNPLTDREKPRKVRLTFQFTLIPTNRGTPDDLGVVFWPPYKVEVRDAPYRVN